MIILIALVYTTHQTLIYQFDANSKLIDGWQSYNCNCYGQINTCRGIQHIGSGSNIFYCSRIFLDLEPHSHIIIVDAQVLSIDSNQGPIMYIDQQLVNYVSEMSSQNSICGNAQAEYIHSISITHQHNRRTLWIYMQQQYGGLISLKLSIIKCQYECAGCIQNQQKFCLQWKMHQYLFNQKFISNFDGWIFGTYSYINEGRCGNCSFLQFYDIKYITQLPPHQDVLIRFFKYDSRTIIVNYLYGKQTISSIYYNQQIDNF